MFFLFIHSGRDVFFIFCVLCSTQTYGHVWYYLTSPMKNVDEMVESVGFYWKNNNECCVYRLQQKKKNYWLYL